MTFLDAGQGHPTASRNDVLAYKVDGQMTGEAETKPYHLRGRLSRQKPASDAEPATRHEPVDSEEQERARQKGSPLVRSRRSRGRWPRRKTMSKRTLGQKHVNPLETRLVVVIQAFALRQRASVDSQGLLRAVALLFGSHFPEIIFQGFAMLVLAALEGAALVFAATAAKASDLDLAVAVRAKANHEEPR